MKYEHGESLSDLKKRPKLFTGFTAFQSYVLESLKITGEDAEAFVSADVSRLHSPFLLPDIREAVKKIRNFILQKKSILLYGDRDTDGVSSTSLLGIYFREQIRKNGGSLSIRTSTANDDYGLCGTVMTQIQNLKPDLLITLDFGTSNEAEINRLASLGIEVIVLDHHEIPVRIPQCLLINPKRSDSIYPEKRICTSALAAKLIMALLIAEKAEEKKRESTDLLFFSPEKETDYNELNYHDYLIKHPDLRKKFEDLLDLAAIGTVTDMMPMLGENRNIVKIGIRTLCELISIEKPSRMGLRSLVRNLGLNKNRITSRDLGWSVGPVLNAAGRMGKTETALKLLLSETEQEAEYLTKEIIGLNQERKERTKRNIFRVDQYFQRKPEREKKRVIFCYEPDMEPGVSGIVATRLVEKYKRPAVFVTPDHGKARGSIRSCNSENVLDVLNMLSEYLEHFGGHPEAGGFSIAINKIPVLERELEEAAPKWLNGASVDERVKKSAAEILPTDLDSKLFDEIIALDPFGQSFSIPLLSLKNVRIIHWKIMGDGSHARFSVQNAGSKIKFVIWNTAKELNSLMSEKSEISLWGSLEENYFQGTASLQFQVEHFE